MKKKNKIRLFVAIDLPIEVIQEVERIQTILKKEKLFEGTFTNPQHIHITLKFIGEIPIDQLPLIEKALSKIKEKSMQVTVRKIDTFSSGNQVKIIFLSIICPNLNYLVQNIEKALLPWAKVKNRPFKSHVTIARVKHLENKALLFKVLEQLSIKSITFTINSFVLKESQLCQKGPIYIDKARYKLAL